MTIDELSAPAGARQRDWEAYTDAVWSSVRSRLEAAQEPGSPTPPVAASSMQALQPDQDRFIADGVAFTVFNDRVRAIATPEIAAIRAAAIRENEIASMAAQIASFAR